MSGNSLPVTGAGTITIGGMVLTTHSFVVLGVTLVALGVVVMAAVGIRTRWRRNRGAGVA